jgi:hypothetical protein
MVYAPSAGSRQLLKWSSGCVAGSLLAERVETSTVGGVKAKLFSTFSKVEFCVENCARGAKMA